MAAGPGGGLIRIGLSGWRYAPWRGRFYPKGLAQRRELEFASRMFPSIELNGSFYSLQAPDSWRRWRDDTPPGFVFAVKGPRFITHILRLRDAATPLANFFASGVLELGDKLGPLLWQLPPSMRFDAEVLGAFLALLPRDTAEARRLARRHDTRMAGRSAFGDRKSRPLRHAFEVRHGSFLDPAFVALLRRRNVALVVADTGGRYPDPEDQPADFTYLRLHGPKELYASGYTAQGLDHWAARASAWARGERPPDAKLAAPDKSRPGPRDLYCYFDNDAKVNAPFDAAGLTERLGRPSPLGPDGRFSFESSPLARPTHDR